MSYQEGASADIGASAAGATTYQTQAQAPTFSKEGGYSTQEGAKISGATSGVNIETNVPLTSTGAEGVSGLSQERAAGAGGRGAVYTDEIQITNFTFMPPKNLMETMGLGGLGFGA